jgi:hypothetical protein
MKKVIFTFLMVLGSIVILQAQVELKPTFGFNVSRLSNEPESFSQSSRLGYQFGGSVQFGKKLYLEPGVYWVKMGSELVHADQASFNYETNINLIRIPVFVGYQIIGGDKENIFGLRVFGGPTGSWVTKISANDNDLDKEEFSNFLWGIDVGAGVDVWLLFLDFGHEWGLNDVFKDDPTNAKNHAWWWNLGVRIRFGG